MPTKDVLREKVLQLIGSASTLQLNGQMDSTRGMALAEEFIKWINGVYVTDRALDEEFIEDEDEDDMDIYEDDEDKCGDEDNCITCAEKDECDKYATDYDEEPEEVVYEDKKTT